jgi:putative oxidoreductase
MEFLFLIGRIIFAGYFLEAAYNHIVNTDNLTESAAKKDVFAPRTSVLVSGLILAFGGVSVLFGVGPRAGLAALIFFIIPVTYTMHAFWKETDSVKRHHEKKAFLKNLMIFGALLMMFGIPTPWPLSLGA